MRVSERLACAGTLGLPTISATILLIRTPAVNPNRTRATRSNPMTPLPTIPQAAAAFRDGTLTPSELLEACLDRIDRFDDRIQAWVLVDRDAAREAARRAEAELRAGTDRGPLHGIPLGIKDIIDVKGLPTKAGSPLRENHVAVQDAPVVAALRRAGAVLVGKTVTVEFACFDPSPTRNPWEPDHHTPGGSSSGSAAAVAIGMCLGALGTQTGGSLVRPSSYCGIATCKPTFGAVDMHGIVPVSPHWDHAGPMARTVADLRAMLSALIPLRQSSKPGKIPPRLGILEQFFMEEADPAVQRVIRDVISKLTDAGAEVVEVPLPFDCHEFRQIHLTVMAADAAAYHREDFARRPVAYGRMISGLLRDGLSSLAVDYAAALIRREELRAAVIEMFHDVDALVMPSTDTTAPPSRDTTGTPKFQAPWSCTGFPAVSLPCGPAEDGMPVGLQLVGPFHQNGALLDVAEWCERRIGFTASPPILQDAI